ncbi:SDR family NAD(P)-dependent oxidoreductase [Curtobacterium sp. YC1]|uniref:SDR family NAD(P)-dependent oxidoreductase n=1 Tax=Curtobacterium sp. YC1 TaxID=2795488 RepID=UPI0018E52D30|nr:SDR family NAD(P)-dependent oxidoreductase [Curtobacterium sp. YC1]QQD77549.1 SDR family NAD(P)-dependent oxidoreductase [Curtobacterium sp. YC1]
MTRITTPFDATTTAAQVLHDLDLTGSRVIVTGGAAGIGAATSEALVRAGASVVLAVRRPEQGERAAGRLRDAVPGASVEARPLDLADRGSVRAFTDAWTGPVDVVIGNAGVMATPERRTPEGWELQFATNHLGHHGLVTGLRDALLAGADRSGRPARVVALSSAGHHTAGVDLDDLMFERRAYDPWVAYGQSKTANALFAVEATRRWGADGIVANAVHPGGILTDLSRHLSHEQALAIGIVHEDGSPAEGFGTPEQGAATSVLVAASPLVEGVGGRYFEDCAEAVAATDDHPLVGVRPWALDPETAERLWDASDALLALR